MFQRKHELRQFDVWAYGREWWNFVSENEIELTSFVDWFCLPIFSLIKRWTHPPIFFFSPHRNIAGVHCVSNGWSKSNFCPFNESRKCTLSWTFVYAVWKWRWSICNVTHYIIAKWTDPISSSLYKRIWKVNRVHRCWFSIYMYLPWT